MEINRIFEKDCLSGLKELPNEYIDCCITSPPYWGLRDYGVNGQLGLEETPEKYIKKLVEIFREVKRVLKKEGTLWLNLGDSYAGSGRGINDTKKSSKMQRNHHASYTGNIKKSFQNDLYKPKDLVGIPWMAAFALRNDGWYLRQDIIWNKPNPMPESVIDRCTKSHEYIFLLTKSSKYYYDQYAIMEPSITSDNSLRDRNNTKLNNTPGRTKMKGLTTNNYAFKNKRSVWNISTEQCKELHFATFPQKLIIDMIKAGTSEKGYCSKCGKPYQRVIEKTLVPTKKASYNFKIDKRDFNCRSVKTLGWQLNCNCNDKIIPAIILDPFMGAGTTALVARKLNRNYIGFELNPQYIQISEERLYNELGMFLYPPASINQS